MSLTLTVIHEGASQDYVVDGLVSLGRSGDNHIVLEAAAVSRHHASIKIDGSRVEFTDLGSANGSRVRGVEAEPRVPVAAAVGDEINVGPFSIVVGGAEQATVVHSAPNREVGGATVVAGSETAILASIPRITVQTPVGSRDVILDKAEITVGRERTNDIVIEQDVVSRRHLVLRRTPGGYVAEDLGTTNGFSVHRERKQQHLLADGDVLDIAGVVSLLYQQAPQESPDTVETALNLKGRKEFTIGRSQRCDIPLDHPAVSLLHARITNADTSPVIEDLGSTNGTFVNGQRIRPGDPYHLSPGDVIRMGPIRFTLGEQGLDQRDESRDIALTAVHLNQKVSSSLNLLKDLSFAILPHEFVAVVGVSGAGKSTLLGALSGLKPASDGQVLLNGSSLYTNFHAFRTTLGYVPQDDILHRELPVGRALNYAAELRLPDDTAAAERRERVATVISTLGLQERRDTAVGKLSGGQRKRVSIGAELLTQPGLFFLDEATSGLDPGTESQLMRLLRRLADEGHTILLITHATKNVMLCDQVLFLAKGGHLAYYGPPDQALKYFEVDDFDGIYEKLEDTRSPEEWAGMYKRSPLYTEFIGNRLAAQGHQLDGSAPAAPPTPPRPVQRARDSSALRQLGILARRYFDIIRRDRVNFAILFLLAPAIGALDFVLWKRNTLSFQSGDGNQALIMMFLAALFPFLVGALSSVREIVKESAIYLRERAVSLQIWPYIFSKASVALMFALFHGAAFVLLKLAAVEFPNGELINYVQMYVTVVLAVMSGVMWALVISALTSREEQAMMLAIGIIVIQVVFSGGIVPLGDLGPPGTVLGAITSTNWAFKALTAAGGLSLDGCAPGNFTNCTLPGFGGFKNDDQRELSFNGLNKSYSDVFDADILVCWGAMLAIIAVLGLVLFFLQKRKDTL
ncbi:MAG: FHA domain-containing protein [Dehalococcoidia bacterium]